MLKLLAALLLSLPLAAQATPVADPARVKTAVTELEKAWKSTEAGERIRAIQAHATVADAEVVKWIAKGLKDKQVDVQKASIEALRWINHPDALTHLQTAAKDNKFYKDQPMVYAALLKAVGQYGNKTSVAILTDDVWSVQEQHVVQARILGLGRIRTHESVEALMDLMKVAGTRKIDNVMPDFRLALVALTGADQGLSQLSWQNWWNDNKNKFKVAPTMGELPKDLERKWKVYWGEMQDEERPKKRSDRGKDEPETPEKKKTGG
jgi:HEAT repeats